MHKHLEQYLHAIEVLRRIEAITRVRDIVPTRIACTISDRPDPEMLPGEPTCAYNHWVDIKDFPYELIWVLSHGEGQDTLAVSLELDFHDVDDADDHYSLTIRYLVPKDAWVAEIEPIYFQSANGKPSPALQALMDRWQLKANVQNPITANMVWSMIIKVCEFFSEQVVAATQRSS